MTVTLLHNDEIDIPVKSQTLDAFRRWSWSDSFPQRGRIDYVSGRIEVDMSPEDVWFHADPKAEISSKLYLLSENHELGKVFVDRTRISNVRAGLSAEPDIVFISRKSFASGGVRLIPNASGEMDRYIELEGSPDLIVELVSDSSEKKDLRRLPKTYFLAGVREYWLVDARGKKLLFQISHRGRGRFTAVKADSKGFQWSAVFSRGFRFKRRRDDLGLWHYDLQMAAE